MTSTIRSLTILFLALLLFSCASGGQRSVPAAAAPKIGAITSLDFTFLYLQEFIWMVQ